MIVSLMVYGVMTSALLAAGARGLEEALRSLRIPVVRFVWLLALGATVALTALAPLRGEPPLSGEASILHPIGSETIPGFVSESAGSFAPLPLPEAVLHSPDPPSRTEGSFEPSTPDLGSFSSGGPSRALGMVPDGIAGVLRATASFAGSRVEPVLGTIWIGSSLTLLIVGVGTVLRYRALVGRLRSIVLDGVRVRVAESVGPAVIGVFRPEVIVPEWLLGRPAEERRLVLLHEREHLAARDPAILLMGCLLVALLPWNPIAWLMLLRLRLAVELDCDARVLRRGVRPRSYGSMLIDVSGFASGLGIGAPAIAGTRTALEQRLSAIAARRSLRGVVRGGALGALGVLALALAGQARLPSASAAQGVDEPRFETVGAMPVGVGVALPVATPGQAVVAPRISAILADLPSGMGGAPAVADTPAVSIPTVLPPPMTYEELVASLPPTRVRVYIDGRPASLEEYHQLDRRSIVGYEIVRDPPGSDESSEAGGTARLQLTTGALAIGVPTDPFRSNGVSYLPLGGEPLRAATGVGATRTVVPPTPRAAPAVPAAPPTPAMPVESAAGAAGATQTTPIAGTVRASFATRAATATPATRAIRPTRATTATPATRATRPTRAATATPATRPTRATTATPATRATPTTPATPATPVTHSASATRTASAARSYSETLARFAQTSRTSESPHTSFGAVPEGLARAIEAHQRQEVEWQRQAEAYRANEFAAALEAHNRQLFEWQQWVEAYHANELVPALEVHNRQLLELQRRAEAYRTNEFAPAVEAYNRQILEWQRLLEAHQAYTAGLPTANEIGPEMGGPPGSGLPGSTRQR